MPSSRRGSSAYAFLLIVWGLGQLWVLEQLLRPMQTLANVVASLREQDYSFRARGGRRGDALGDLALEINALAGELQSERVASLESAALVERILAVMEAPVLAFDQEGMLRLLNPAGARLLQVRSPGAGAGTNTRGHLAWSTSLRRQTSVSRRSADGPRQPSGCCDAAAFARTAHRTPCCCLPT